MLFILLARTRSAHLQEFYFFAVTSVTRWGKWMEIIGAKLYEMRAERNGKTMKNNWIEMCLLNLVLIVVLLLEKEWVMWCVVTLVTEKKQKLLLCVRARDRKP